MVATHLIVGAAIGRAQVERIVIAQVLLDPERDPDEAAGVLEDVGPGRAGDLCLDHPVAELEPFDDGELLVHLARLDGGLALLRCHRLHSTPQRLVEPHAKATLSVQRGGLGRHVVQAEACGGFQRVRLVRGLCAWRRREDQHRQGAEHERGSGAPGDD